MTSALFIIKDATNPEMIVRVGHDGHTDGLWSKPLFKFLKINAALSTTLVMRELASIAELTRSEAPELHLNEDTATSSDYTYRIDLIKRTWKVDGFKQRSF